MLTLEHLAALAQEHREASASRVREFSLGSAVLAFNSRPAVMGVINLSADSWYRESVSLSTEKAVQRGRVLAAQGADLVQRDGGVLRGASSPRADGVTSSSHDWHDVPSRPHYLQHIARLGALVAVAAGAGLVYFACGNGGGYVCGDGVKAGPEQCDQGKLNGQPGVTNNTAEGKGVDRVMTWDRQDARAV